MIKKSNFQKIFRHKVKGFPVIPQPMELLIGTEYDDARRRLSDE
jgi:hypothetical protein